MSFVLDVDGIDYRFILEPKQVQRFDRSQRFNAVWEEVEAYFGQDRNGDYLVIVEEKYVFRLVYGFRRAMPEIFSVEQVELTPEICEFRALLGDVFITQCQNRLVIFRGLKPIHSELLHTMRRCLFTFRGETYALVLTLLNLRVYKIGKRATEICIKPLPDCFNIGPICLRDCVYFIVQGTSDLHCFKMYPSERIVSCAIEPLQKDHHNYILTTWTEEDGTESAWVVFYGVGKQIEAYRFTSEFQSKVPCPELLHEYSGEVGSEWVKDGKLRGFKLGPDAFYIEGGRIRRRKQFVYLEGQKPEVCPVCLAASAEDPDLRFVIPFCEHPEHAVCEVCWSAMEKTATGRVCPMCRGV